MGDVCARFSNLPIRPRAEFCSPLSHSHHCDVGPANQGESSCFTDFSTIDASRCQTPRKRHLLLTQPHETQTVRLYSVVGCQVVQKQGAQVDKHKRRVCWAGPCLVDASASAGKNEEATMLGEKASLSGGWKIWNDDR